MPPPQTTHNVSPQTTCILSPNTHFLMDTSLFLFLNTSHPLSPHIHSHYGNSLSLFAQTSHTTSLLQNTSLSLALSLTSSAHLQLLPHTISPTAYTPSRHYTPSSLILPLSNTSHQTLPRPHILFPISHTPTQHLIPSPIPPMIPQILFPSAPPLISRPFPISLSTQTVSSTFHAPPRHLILSP